MKKQSASSSAFFSPRALIALLLCTAACSTLTGTLLAFLHPKPPANTSQRTLTFEERVSYQQAIEDVYWRHRIWPKERPDPKPSLDAVMSQAQLEKKVADYLRNSQALEDYWQRPITAEQLQAEMERMAKHTRQPEVLRELFEALGNDPFVIAECLARPVLTERLVADLSAQDKTRRFESGSTDRLRTVSMAATAGDQIYTLPTISEGDPPCIDDTWTPTSLTNAPDARDGHTAVWTGTEMIVWGGINFPTLFNTGGRYNPSTDSWTTISIANAPDPRYLHTSVWTGSEMIVWGGGGGNALNTGGRYNPNTDSWTATSTTGAPAGREYHTAVWTGTEMIVWGGIDIGDNHLNTGGRYAPSTDSWTATSLTNAPDARDRHTAVWTGTEMIVWGGYSGGSFVNTGGRYNPGTDGWTATSTTGAPDGRELHTALWTGSEMIIWGGDDPSYLNTGGRYSPATDSWTATNTAGAPTDRELHTVVWTGSEMVVWGGYNGSVFNSGGRYCAQSGPTPTPTPSVTPTPSGTLTPTPTATATPRVTPRPRPTPHARPTP